MWPLKRQADVVRVGRDRVEYWTGSAHGLALRGKQALDCAEGPGASALAAGLGTLLQTVSSVQGEPSATHAVKRAIDVVFESAWLPIMLIEAGDSLWSRKTLEALLRHRLAQLYKDASHPVAAWDLQLDYRPGNVRCLGYGLAPSIKQATVDTAAAADLRLASLQPAFAWGWQRLGPQVRRSRRWWLWLEQDRSLVCHFDERAQLDALNTGAPMAEDTAQCLRLIEIEALRQGLPAQELHGSVVDWREAPYLPGGAGDRVTRVSVVAAGAAASSPATTPMQAEVGA